MKLLYILTILFGLSGTATSQRVLKIEGSSGISKITYILSKTSEKHYFDLLISGETIGIEEYNFDVRDVNITYEKDPFFVTIKCMDGKCIEKKDYTDSHIRKYGIPILLSGTIHENKEHLSKLNDFLDTEAKVIDRKSAEEMTWIPLRSQESGTLGISVGINGIIETEFILDSGASLICINSILFDQLIESGTLTKYDILDRVKTTIADGSITDNLLVNLKKVTIGSFKFKDVKCIVTENTKAPLLLGQNILRSFGIFSINYDKNRLYIVD